MESDDLADGWMAPPRRFTTCKGKVPTYLQVTYLSYTNERSDDVAPGDVGAPAVTSHARPVLLEVRTSVGPSSSRLLQPSQFGDARRVVKFRIHLSDNCIAFCIPKYMATAM